MPALDQVGLNRAFLSGDEQGIRDFARLCCSCRRHHRHRPGGHAGRRRGRHAAAADRRRPATRCASCPLLRLIGMTPTAAVQRAQELRRTQHRAAAPGPHQGGGRWFDPGLFGAGCAGPAISTARPTACGTRRPRPCARPTRWACRPACWSTPTPTATRPPRLVLDCMAQALAGGAHAGPPLHAAALPAGRRRAVPAHEGAGHVRQPVCQPPFLLGRPAPRRDGGPRACRAHERLRHRAALPACRSRSTAMRRSRRWGRCSRPGARSTG